MPAPIALQGVTPEELARLPGVGLPDARRVLSRVYRDLPHNVPSSQIRRVSLDAILAATELPSLQVVEEYASALDPFRKWVLRTRDDELVETVRIPLHTASRFSVCVSSQVGCALGCTFCATGRLGLRRNLEAWEIVEQVRIVRRSLPPGGKVHGVVFQGMGEPLANLDRVLTAISIFRDPSGLAIDTRAITVCTSGLPAGIRRLAKEAPNVRLGVSISSAIAETRRTLMPIERAHPLDEVMAAAVEHAKATRLSPMFAVTLLSGVNDTPEHANALANLIARFVESSGHRPRLSVIPYNTLGETDPFSRTSDADEEQFRAVLRTRGVSSHKRYSGGSDVAAACGQLAARQEKL